MVYLLVIFAACSKNIIQIQICTPVVGSKALHHVQDRPGVLLRREEKRIIEIGDKPANQLILQVFTALDAPAVFQMDQLEMGIGFLLQERSKDGEIVVDRQRIVLRAAWIQRTGEQRKTQILCQRLGIQVCDLHGDIGAVVLGLGGLDFIAEILEKQLDRLHAFLPHVRLKGLIFGDILIGYEILYRFLI